MFVQFPVSPRKHFSGIDPSLTWKDHIVYIHIKGG